MNTSNGEEEKGGGGGGILDRNDFIYYTMHSFHGDAVGGELWKKRK